MPSAQKQQLVTIHAVKEALLTACTYLAQADEIITELEPSNKEDDGPNIQHAIQKWRALAAQVDKQHTLDRARKHRR